MQMRKTESQQDCTIGEQGPGGGSPEAAKVVGVILEVGRVGHRGSVLEHAVIRFESGVGMCIKIDSPGQLTVQEEPANLQQDPLVKVTVGAPCEPYAKIEIDAIGVPEDFARDVSSYDVEAQQEEPKRRVLQEDSRVKAVALGAPCKPAPLGAHEGEKHSDTDDYGNSTPADLLTLPSHRTLVRLQPLKP